MFIIQRINNLTPSFEKLDNLELARQMSDLATANIIYSNKKSYNQSEMHVLLSNKTTSSYLELINRSFIVSIYNDKQELIGCGLISVQDGKHFAKSLHIHRAYRSMGLARLICEDRERFLKNLGVSEIYIESLKFPKTIEFHKRRGFAEITPYKELKNTILLKKVLI